MKRKRENDDEILNTNSKASKHNFSKIVTYSKRKKQNSSEYGSVSLILTKSKEETNKPELSYSHSPSSVKMVQSTLDFGQKNIGQTLCSECGMLYFPSNTEDCQIHASFHKKKLQSFISFGRWKNEVVVKEFPKEEDSRIILLDSETAPKVHLRKLAVIKEMVDNELGITDEKEVITPMKIFLYIHSGKLIGVLMAEPITQAFPVIPDTGSTIRCSKEPITASCGINRIWVHKEFRRKGIATILMDVVRFNFIYGSIVPTEECAFTQPTPDGKVFFSHYTKNPKFLVYHN